VFEGRRGILSRRDLGGMVPLSNYSRSRLLGTTDTETCILLQFILKTH